MQETKLCKDCMALNRIDAEACVYCGGTDFDDVHMPPRWDAIEPYVEEEQND